MARPDQEKEEFVIDRLEFAWTKSRLHLEVLLGLMKEAGFPIRSSRETVQKFKKGQRTLQPGDVIRMYRYFTETDFGRSLAGEPRMAADHDAPSRAKLGTAEPIAVRLRAANPPRPECLTKSILLGTVVIEASQWGAGTVYTSLTVTCPDWEGCAVQRGRVRMDPHPGRLVEAAESDRFQPSTITMQGHDGPGKVDIRRGFSTSYDPFWDIRGVDGPIGHLTTDGDFAPLENLSPGDRVTATLGTWLGDIEESKKGDSAADAANSDVLTDGLTVVEANRQAPALVDPKGYKRRLISLIRQTALNAGPDGYVELSRCVLDIVEDGSR